MIVDFFCPGVPAAQGSKRHVGGGVMIESSRALRPWRGSVTAAAADAMKGRPPLDGPLRLEARFVMPRPKAHFNSKGALKNTAPLLVSKRPDVEKLLRAISDAMSSVVWRDDAQVAEVIGRKVYGDLPGVRVVVTSVPERPWNDSSAQA